ncbi:MAG: adhesion protein FadA [Fusobacterium sp.]|nr:adhesion protein FadA [Fusobacterium sp.]
MFGLLVFLSVLFYSNLSYADEKGMNILEEIEIEYQELQQKEMEKIVEFKAEKAKLEEELEALKEKQIGKDKNYEKLKRDSEIRWHRDEYKKLLKKYDEYQRKLEAAIEEREMKIVELEKLLSILGE